MYNEKLESEMAKLVNSNTKKSIQTYSVLMLSTSFFLFGRFVFSISSMLHLLS